MRSTKIVILNHFDRLLEICASMNRPGFRSILPIDKVGPQKWYSYFKKTCISLHLFQKISPNFFSAMSSKCQAAIYSWVESTFFINTCLELDENIHSSKVSPEIIKADNEDDAILISTKRRGTDAADVALAGRRREEKGLYNGRSPKSEPHHTTCWEHL